MPTFDARPSRLPALLLALALGGVGTLAAPPAAAADNASAEAEAPAPALLLAQPFTVAAPWPHAWHADRAPVTEGLVLVVEVDPDVARPRQAGGAVLYVGEVPAERITWSPTAARMVVVVPGPVDLAETPIFWGPDTLPEQVTPAVGATALAEAQVAPRPAAERAAARAEGGAPWAVQDQADLYRRIAPLVRTWVPDDAARVDGWD